jgi:hypothetical protein
MSRTTQSFITDFDPIGRRTGSHDSVLRRAVIVRLKPFVGQFDAWLKEVAQLSGTLLARATTGADNQRLYERARELTAEVGDTYREFQRETSDIAADGRVGDMTRSYERLISMLSNSSGR